MIRSRLEKYRRPRFGILTKQYNIKLSDDMANDLEQVSGELDMSPAEFIRLLLYEELQALKEKEIPEDSNSKPSLAISNQGYPQVNTKAQPKTPRRSAPAGVRFTYGPWKVANKLYCIECQDWKHSSTFRNRHAEPHGYAGMNPMKEYIKVNLDILDQKYEEATGKRPEYNPDMLK